MPQDALNFLVGHTQAVKVGCQPPAERMPAVPHRTRRIALEVVIGMDVFTLGTRGRAGPRRTSAEPASASLAERCRLG